jgi:hypothetical protein
MFKPAMRKPGQRQQRGLAFVEFAIVLPVIIMLITFPIFFCRVFAHYSVIQKAAHDAAVYFATVPLADMKDFNRADAARDAAEAIIAEEVAELRPGAGSGANFVVLCDGGPCGSGKPEQISVQIRMRMYDDYFYFLTWPVVGDDGVLVSAAVTLAYLGQ